MLLFSIFQTDSPSEEPEMKEEITTIAPSATSDNKTTTASTMVSQDTEVTDYETEPFTVRTTDVQQPQTGVSMEPSEETDPEKETDPESAVTEEAPVEQEIDQQIIDETLSIDPITKTTAESDDIADTMQDDTTPASVVSKLPSDEDPTVKDATGEETEATTISAIDAEAEMADKTPSDSGVEQPETVTKSPQVPSSEKSCEKDSVIYEDGESVPVMSTCQENCMCVNSVIHCTMQVCHPSPPAFLQCTPVEQLDQCCPSYDCRKLVYDNKLPQELTIKKVNTYNAHS